MALRLANQTRQATAEDCEIQCREKVGLRGFNNSSSVKIEMASDLKESGWHSGWVNRTNLNLSLSNGRGTIGQSNLPHMAVIKGKENNISQPVPISGRVGFKWKTHVIMNS